MQNIDPAKAPRILSSQQAADRLGLPVQTLYKLRDFDERLAISQTGLKIGYQLDALQSYERSEMLSLVEQTLAADRPLPLIRAMTQLLRAPIRQQVEDSPIAPCKERSSVVSTPALVPPPNFLPNKLPAVFPTMAWFLVHSKSRQEAVALTNLVRQGFETYLPMITIEKLVRRKKTVVQETMFARYLFVRLDTSGKGQSWSPIRSTVGVSELVRFGSQAAKVDEALIAKLREREALQRETPEALFKEGENVVITEGAFAGLEAIYQMNDAEGRAMVLLDLLSKPVNMTIDSASLRKVG